MSDLGRIVGGGVGKKGRREERERRERGRRRGSFYSRGEPLDSQPRPQPQPRQHTPTSIYHEKEFTRQQARVNPKDHRQAMASSESQKSRLTTLQDHLPLQYIHANHACQAPPSPYTPWRMSINHSDPPWRCAGRAGPALPSAALHCPSIHCPHDQGAFRSRHSGAKCVAMPFG
jgi:hypothetical protein